MLYYIIEFGEDCDGVPASNGSLTPYESLDEAVSVAGELEMSSDGLSYIVIDEEQAKAEGFLS